MRGTNQFMAPEIVRDEAMPSTVTDLYSLAVFLFILFMRGHPLEGRRSIAAYSWQQTEHVSENELLLRNFGFEPLFVFDPDDDVQPAGTGQPDPHLLADLPALLPRAGSSGSFTDGPHRRLAVGPDHRERLAPRPVAPAARPPRHLRCRAAVFFDPDEPARPCWRCGEVPPTPALLRLPGRTVVLSEGVVITADHLRRDRG